MSNANAAAEFLAAPKGAGTRFGRLSALAPVGLDAAACLHLQKPWVTCTRCKDVCPADCLSLDEGTFRLDATACLHCGRCAANCPTQALAVEGFDAFEAVETFGLDEAHAPVVSITCPKKPMPEGATIRVPCLGGLHVNDLLARLGKRPGQRLRLAADAGCSACACGRKDAAPAQGLAVAIEPILRSSSVPSDRFSVGSTSSSLPDGNSRSRSAAPSRTDGPAASRRAFFSGLGRAVSDRVVRQAGRASALLDPKNIAKAPRITVPHARSQDTRALMQKLAACFGATPADIVRPQVAVSNACRLHGTCARLCPTGALRVSDADRMRALRLDASRCIDCGACADACPESALQFAPPAWRDFEPATVVLSQRRVSECARCGELTPDLSIDGLCAHCDKSAGLARAGFSLFARGGSTRPAETGPP